METCGAEKCPWGVAINILSQYMISKCKSLIGLISPYIWCSKMRSLSYYIFFFKWLRWSCQLNVFHPTKNKGSPKKRSISVEQFAWFRMFLQLPWAGRQVKPSSWSSSRPISAEVCQVTWLFSNGVWWLWKENR